ncbi:MAG: undecaprenyldiphospho-muramoylpentapeptide beta-N-acetylglucosaminyltransferase [Bdellovibrionales bacterium]|nr:undecaprenyldiphospho-muramoylpentapeptide beta-N-acetylglucosaminyltransferase [Bdellovibrionales bacterium]
MQKKSNKIILTGGGTGGHIYPGLAVAQALQKIDPDLKIIFVGADRPLDKTILLKIGYPFYLLPIGPLNVNSTLKKIITLLGIPWAFLKAYFLLLRLRPSIVMGFGGYASFPSLVAARLLGIPFAVWEANAHPGLVTRTIGKRANLIFLNFSDKDELFAIKKVYKYGTPTRFKPVKVEKSNSFRVLVFGGSSGARAINEIVYAFLAKVNAGEQGYEKYAAIEFVHQIGSTDYEKFKKMYKDFKIKLDVREFIHNMPEELAKADFLICRAGASTVAEIALSKKAGLLVPLPWAADNHQVLNAKRLSDVGAALLVEQKDFNPQKLGEILQQVTENPNLISNIEEKVSAFANQDSAEKIAKKLLDYISYKSLL